MACTEKLNNDSIRHLWAVTLKPLSTRGEKQELFNQYIACKESLNQRMVILRLKQRFTPEWWEGYLITSIIYMGELVMFDEIPLYDRS